MEPKLMKAITYSRYGGPEVLEFGNIAIPEIKNDEVLVKVAATSFNPFDVILRSGNMQQHIPLTFPISPGSDISGIVEKKGTDVKSLSIGDKVFGMTDITINGSSLEYAVVKANSLIAPPKSISLQDAATIPGVSLTAWQALFDHIKLESGNRILIVAASGGVGAAAVQLAKWKGAYVIGTASEKNFPMLKSFGVDELIDHRVPHWQSTIPRNIDAVFNLGPLSPENANALLTCIKKGGKLITAPSIEIDKDKAASLNIETMQMFMQYNTTTLSQIAHLIDIRILTTNISETVLLEQLPSIHVRYTKETFSGKVKVVVNESL